MNLTGLFNVTDYDVLKEIIKLFYVHMFNTII